MSAYVIRERECLHRARGAEGDFYTGTDYVKLIQRLPVEAATQTARKVTPFFWSDAAQIAVWLCAACAVEVGFEAERQTSAA